MTQQQQHLQPVPMRNTLLALILFGIASPVFSADTISRPTFINAKVSAKQICLNEPLRLEFTTMPRDVEGVDIGKSVANSLRLGAAVTWRLLGEPIVSEVLRGSVPSDDKTSRDRPKPVSVTVNLLPRTAGDLQLPDIPITWLQGNTVARFSIVTVTPQVMIIGTARDLPREINGVGGFAWSTTQDEARGRIAANLVKKVDNRTVMTPQEHLGLVFEGGMFAEATLRAPGLTIDQARTSFLQRWGVPHIEDATSLTWILGWTRIVATPSADGISINLMREDVQAQLSRTQVSTDVFGVLDGPAQTPKQAEEQRNKAIEQEVNRPAVPQQ
jgi:hypothetical protein